MKQFRISLVLAFLIFTAGKTHAETTNQWGSPVFGTQLSISLSNSVITAGSQVLLFCSITNLSTNNVCFTKTDSRGMYDVFLIDDLGQSIEINNPANVGDVSLRIGGVRPGESFECPVPLVFNDTINPGHYKIIVKQRIFLIKNFGFKNIVRSELISNSLDLQIK
jgi:hypothetical protein